MPKRKNGEDIPFDVFKAFTFGSAAELISTFGSLEAARDRWFEVRGEFLERWDLWGRPEAWWLFEPDIPQDLRAGPPAVITYADADQWNRLDRARRDYLSSIGIDPSPERRYTPFGTD